MFDRIRSEVSILNVVGSHVKLKKSGSNFTGLCPFHPEKTPSFVVNVEKSFYHCFGCSAHGDVINFVAKIKNLDYKDAAIQIAKENNIAISPNYYKDRESQTEIDQIVQVLEKANQFFVRCLNDNVIKYLNDRLITQNSIDFSIGYAPDNGKLIHYLESQGVKYELMHKAGLVKKGSYGSFYDFFRNRITFPINERSNRIVGFGSRSIDANNKIKYLNSPESAIFHKSDLLFGLEKTVKHAIQNNRYIVVEGYLDVISMHKIGYKETVGVLGTAISQKANTKNVEFS